MGRLVPPDISSPRFKADPYPFYARLRAEAPVYRVRLSFWLSAWLVTRYDDALFVLKDGPFSNSFFKEKMRWLPRVFEPFTRHLLNSDPPDHMRLRTLVSKAFTPRAIERLQQRIQKLCDELLERAARKGRLELVRDYALPVPLTVIAEMLGIPPEDRSRFDAWTARVVAGSGGDVPGFVLGLPALVQSMRYLRELIARRRAKPEDDMVTALLRAEEAGDRLGEDEVIGMLSLLILAGYETTMGLVSSGTLALIQHPEQRRRFVEEPAIVPSAVEELLRFTSPLDTAAFRIASEDVEVAGVTIPKGDVVLAMLGSANRDPRHFPNPDTLDLAREPNRHLAFGAGPHVCLGAALARMEGRLALTTLFQRFPDLRLDGPAEAVPWRRGLFFRGPKRLPLILS